MAGGALRAAARHFVLKKRLRRHDFRGVAAAIGLAVLVVLLPRSARADDVVAARQHFADGIRLFQQGDYEGARRLFKKADAEHHAAPIVYNLGLAEERSGRPQAAIDAYEAYVAESGDGGELASAAIVAIAQIKARSTRLRIETKPAGARLFVDASTLPEPSPATFLVSGGHHVVVARGEGWQAEQEIDAKGGGEALTIVMGPPAPAEAIAPAVAVVPAPTSTAVPAPSPAIVDVDQAKPPAEGKPDGFVWGASFAVAPYHMQGAQKAGSQNAAGLTLAMAGAIFEAGHALTDRLEFVGRAFVALGPEGKPSYGWMGGPGLSLRIGSSGWLGATFIGGQLETKDHDIPYGTDLVFGVMGEAALVVVGTHAGQWTVGAHPGLLLTGEETHNTAFFLPVTFGYRAY